VLVIITDIPTYELEPIGEKDARADSFILESTDGSYAKTIILNQQYMTSEGWADLMFEDLPIDLNYSLKSTLHGENEVFLFENVPYVELSNQSETLSALEKEPSEFGEF
jgi:hypothetical protein